MALSKKNAPRPAAAATVASGRAVPSNGAPSPALTSAPQAKPTAPINEVALPADWGNGASAAAMAVEKTSAVPNRNARNGSTTASQGPAPPQARTAAARPA